MQFIHDFKDYESIMDKKSYLNALHWRYNFKKEPTKNTNIKCWLFTWILS